MADTSIQWTDNVWNPTRGCPLKSSGCSRCYAMRMAHRFSGPGQPYEGLTRLGAKGPVWTGEVREIPEMLDLPPLQRKPARIFVANMGDLFHESIPDEFIAAVFGVMAMCPMHTFQVLTKRAERMVRWFEWLEAAYDGPCARNAVLQTCLGQLHEGEDDDAFYEAFEEMLGSNWPLPNVWLGVSTEDQATANERIPHLLRVPAAVRFLSCEPLLGPIRLRSLPGSPTDDEDVRIDPLAGRHYLGRYDESGVPDGRIAWVVLGGESGHHARPCDIDWIRSVVRQCRDASIPAFVKQLGAHVEACDIIDAADAFPGSVRLSPGTLPHNARVHLRDPKGGDIEEFPADLRVREFPAVEAASDA